MFDFIRANQMDIMLALCAACCTMALMLLFTRFLQTRRKWILICQELVVMFLLGFDREAYIYSGNLTRMGYVMVRVSNFMVFFLTSAVVLCFNTYLMDWFLERKNIVKMPKRLIFTAVGSVCGMIIVVISQFTGWIYYIDGQNRYFRGNLFLIAYIVPIICPLIQYSVIAQYRKIFSRMMFIGLNLYIFVPIIMALIQLKAYGLSLVNMSLVLMSVGLYIFTYLDINDEVERVHRLELDNLQEARKSMERLFEQTASVMVTAVEKRDPYSKGRAARIADKAGRLAERTGHDENWCNNIRYAAMLHEAGLAALPDKLIAAGGEELKKMKAATGEELLSYISEYPWLAETLHSLNEHYDGSGYPDGLKAEEIPEMSRMIAIAEGFDSLMSAGKDHSALPYTVAREEMLKKAGTLYDPALLEQLKMILDAENEVAEQAADFTVVKELECGNYRDRITGGIEVSETESRISFKCESVKEAGEFSEPAIVLFDAFDRHVHSNEMSIGETHYMEYGELWFDGHYVCTAARHIEAETSGEAGEDDGRYLITAGRYEDHIRIVLEHAGKKTELCVVLPDSTRSSYIGLTGENCRISEIEIEKTGRHYAEGDIPRLADKVSFINRLVSDIPNVQVNRFRSAYSEGIPLKNETKVIFHSMSLPTSHLVWHCPHLFIYSSKDGRQGGEGYREYAVIKLDGENDSPLDIENSFVMKKGADFPGWEEWKDRNREGLEYELNFRRKGNKLRFTMENLGIAIENTTILPEDAGEVYAALTGDQCAFTDIRIKQG
ncbi:MAG: diguanylate cyclase [Lachnospiraceae bacterium]|nr:diguanylate cyclase [Lachnospiraceae bacterium]